MSLQPNTNPRLASLLRSTCWAFRGWLWPAALAVAGLLILATIVLYQNSVARQQREREAVIQAERNAVQARTQQAQAQQDAVVRAEQAVAQNAQAERDAQMKAASELEAYRDRYLAERTAKATGRVLAIAAAGVDGRADGSLTASLTSAFQQRGVVVASGLFSAAFASDGLFDRISNGDNKELQRLDLSRYASELLLAKKDLAFEKLPEHADYVSARLALNMKRIDAQTGRVLEDRTVTASGVGIDKTRAEAMAVERLIAQVTK